MVRAPSFRSSVGKTLNFSSKNEFIRTWYYDPLFNEFFVNKKRSPNQNLPDVPWEETWSGVRRALRFLVTPEDMIREYCRWAEIDPNALVPLLRYPTNLVIPFFSALKTDLLRNTDRLPDTFRFWIDIVYLSGYPKMDDRETTDDPFAWLSSDVPSQYTAVWWENAFAKTFGESVIRTPIKLLSFEEFAIRRWLWSTEGATSFTHLMLNNEAVKTKFAAAVSLSDEELFDLIKFKRDRDSIRIFIKPDEAGYKRRLIANVPLGAYINASYIRYLLEAFVGADPKFMQLEVSPEEGFNVCELLRERRMAMPLDESAYDYHVSRESWLGFISFLRRHFPGNSGVDYFAEYFHSADWVDPLSKDSGKWTSGMPSGLALTSFLNSWMNYIKQQEITPGELAWAAGDDVLTFPYSRRSLVEIESEYEKFGSSVNAMKNWQSWSWAEYLKVLYFSSGSTGYPARIFGTLLWAGAQRTFLPADRLPELAELFKQFFDRLGLRMTRPDIERYIAADLSRAVSQKVEGFSTQRALEWLHAPRAYGGFGCLPYNDIVFDWVTTVRSRSNYVGAIIRLPPVLSFNTEVELRVRREPWVERTFYTGPPLILPPIEDLSQWESRVNLDDIPVRGKYATAALDVIPLPTIDLVSTRNVASFASSWGFNVYPNLRGTTSRIPSRLVSASLVLARQVADWMTQRRVWSLS